MPLHRPNQLRRPHLSAAAILAMSLRDIFGAGSEAGRAHYGSPYRQSAQRKPQRVPRKKKPYNRACQCVARRHRRR